MQREHVSECPFLIEQWDYELNYSFDPFKLTCGSDKRVHWICSQGHRWEASISGRYYQKRGCPYCSNQKVLVGYNDLPTTNPELLEEWDDEKNGKLTPEMITAGSNKLVWWKCASCGHVWKARPCHRAKGHGCFKCGRKTAGAKTRITKAEKHGCLSKTHPALVKEWDFSRNQKCSPETVSRGSDEKVWWICERGHHWEATVSSRVGGHNCPVCSMEMHTSFEEQAFLFYLSKVTKTESREKKFGKELDVFLPELNCGIEYNGRYWHQNPERDQAKVSFLKKQGLRVITIIEGKKNSVSNDVIEYQYSHHNNQLLNWAICETFSLLGIPGIPVDFEKDTSQIYDLYKSFEVENSIAKKYPDLTKEWDEAANGKCKPEHFGSGSEYKAFWKCEKGHKWQAKIYSRVKGNGCPVCAGKKVQAGFNDLETVRPDISKEWNYSRNEGLTPQMVVAGSHKKVWWKCDKGHEWEADIHSRTGQQKCGCPYCGNRKLLQGFNDLETQFPKIAEQWHPTKNNQLSPRDVLAGARKMAWWKCGKGHEWEANISDRTGLRNHGCPYCKGRKVLKGFNDLKTTHPNLAREWNYDKNTNILPDEVSAGSDRKVWWLCSFGHEWETSINKRANGRGCPICSKRKHTAKDT